MNTIVLEIFLGECEKGIMIKIEGQDNIFMDKFEMDIKDDGDFVIIDAESHKEIIIHKIDECELKEFRDYIVIHRNNKKIIIEEMI